MSDYAPGEERVTSATGGMKGRKDGRFGGGDPLAFMELAKVYGMGEQKYDRYNYLKGYAWSLSVDALFRHLFAFLSGEDRDPESGLLHTAHVAWHGLTLTSFQLRSCGTDDRAPTLWDEAIFDVPTCPGNECTCMGCSGQRDLLDEEPCECAYQLPCDKHPETSAADAEALVRDAMRLVEKGYYKDAFALLGVTSEDFGCGDGPVTECAPHCDHGIALHKLCGVCWLTS